MGNMETVTSRDGTPIAYERSGEGPPLILVHGTTSDHFTWELVLPELQKHFTVYAIDRRGRGESGSGDGSAYDIEREFEDVVALIDSIGGTVGLLGHSYGAICALEGALRSSWVGGLVLYEGTFPVPEGTELYPPEDTRQRPVVTEGGRPRRRAHDLLPRHRADLARGDRDVALASHLGGPGSLAPTIPHEMRAFESYVSNFDPARLGNLRTPTLLLLGGDSLPLERAAAESLDSALPDGQIVVMPNQAHLAHRTAPELFVREVVRFLKQA